MAEIWASLKNVRIKLHDPSGCINLVSVENYAALPETPSRQTAYRTADSGNWYMFFDMTQKWTALDIKISDDRLNELIDQKGELGAVVSAIPEIISGLYDSLQLVSHSNGTESMQYVTIEQAISFYEKLKDMFVEQKSQSAGVNTGVFIRTCNEVVGGIPE